VYAQLVWKETRGGCLAALTVCCVQQHLRRWQLWWQQQEQRLWQQQQQKQQHVPHLGGAVLPPTTCMSGSERWSAVSVDTCPIPGHLAGPISNGHAADAGEGRNIGAATQKPHNEASMCNAMPRAPYWVYLAMWALNTWGAGT
jgi:hypothetical protein